MWLRCGSSSTVYIFLVRSRQCFKINCVPGHLHLNTPAVLLFLADSRASDLVAVGDCMHSLLLWSHAKLSSIENFLQV